MELHLKTSRTNRKTFTENGTVKRPGRKVFVPALAACLALGLNGCLINRVVEVKEQFCDFDSNFSLEFADSADFNFHHPILLDRDILWIADAAPTELIETGDELLMVFVLEKTVPEPRPEDEIRVELSFDLLDGQYRLSGVQFDPMLNAIINPEFLDATAIATATQTLCETGWSFASTGVEMDISGQDLDDLPGRTEILDWLGPPLERDEENDSLTYEYRLKGEQKEPVLARFTVWFDDSGEKPAQMESSYSRFRTQTDFVQKTVSMKVDI
jgi:hypothetical protein